MRILFVIRDMVNGGAGKQLALTANALSQKGHKVFVYSYCGDENCHFLDDDVQYIAQNPMPKSKIQEYVKSVWNIRKQLHRVKPNVVISWRCNAGCFTKIASLGLPLKTVFSERTDPYTETSFALKISAFIASFSDGGVFQTEPVRKYYKRLYSKSVVIHNPFDPKIDCHSSIAFENRNKEIVHIGRMVISHKRQDVMLKAFAAFAKKHDDYVLSFYGGGPDFNKVRNLAKDLQIDKKVAFHGDVIGAAKKIGAAKLLVLTSDYEGIPNVIMEAFAMGVPVVSTDCSPGGARVLIEDGENGFVVPVGNADIIAHRMCEIVENEKLAENFIVNGKEKLNQFCPQKIFQMWNDFLESL